MKIYSHYGINEFIICAGYKQHVIKEWFADYFLHTSDITFDFTQGNKIIVHDQHAESWKVTVVDTGLNTMTGGRVKRIKKFVDDEPFCLGGALKEIITYENHIAQHLWFVIVLFLIFVVNILLSKANQKTVCWLLTIIPLFALPLLKAVSEIPDVPNYFLFEIPFFMVGRLLVQEKEILKKVTTVNPSPIIFVVLAGVYIFFIEGTDILPQPIRWIYLFSTRCMGICMVLSVSAVVEKGRVFNAVFKYLESKSYPIYLLHQPFIVSGVAGVLNAVGVPYFLIILPVTVLGILVPLIIDRILENNNLYRFLILGGRTNKRRD